MNTRFPGVNCSSQGDEVMEGVRDLAIVERTVKVNRTRSHFEVFKALRATGRLIYGRQALINSMPQSKNEDVQIVFFQAKHNASNAEVLKMYDFYNFVPVDPIALFDLNTKDPAFADSYPNATIWQSNHYVAFYNCFYVAIVDRRENIWPNFWWFAGVRKITSVPAPLY